MMLAADSDGGGQTLPAGNDAAQAVPRLRIALQEPETDEVPARIGRVFASALVRELRKMDRTTTVSMDEVRALIEQESSRQLAGCDGGDSCVGEIADALGADELVVSRLSRVGGEHILSVRRLNATNPGATRGFERRFKATDGEEFLSAVGPVVEELWPERPLHSGATRGVATEVARRLNPPPLSPTWFVTSSVVTGVGLAGGLGAGALALVLHDGNQQTLNSSVDREIDGPALVQSNARAQTAALAAQVGFAVAAVGGVTSVVVFFLTDFAGVADVDE